MLGFQTMPDSSGSVWFEPTSVDLSNESFSYIVLKYEESPCLVQAIQGSATSLDVAPSSASGRVETKITITATDISAGSTLQFGVSRATTGTDAAVAGPIYVHGVLFEYEDV